MSHVSHVIFEASKPREHPLKTLQASDEPKVIAWAAAGLERGALPGGAASTLFRSFAALGAETLLDPMKAEVPGARIRKRPWGALRASGDLGSSQGAKGAGRQAAS